VNWTAFRIALLVAVFFMWVGSLATTITSFEFDGPRRAFLLHVPHTVFFTLAACFLLASVVPS
jgi:hypothetical protein